MIYFISKQKRAFLLPGIEVGEIEDCIEWCKEKYIIELDTETTELDPYTSDLLSIQLGDYDTQWVIECTKVPGKIADILQDKTKTFLLQNAAFDLKILYRQGIIVSNVWDTFLAECILNTGKAFIRKSLDALALRYLDVFLDKTIRGLINREGFTDRVIKYAADDVKYLGKIKDKQTRFLEEEELMKVVDLENKFVYALAYLEYCGIYMDPVDWKQKIEEDKIMLASSEKGLDKWIIEKGIISPQLNMFEDASTMINWSSSHQVVPILKKLGIDTQIEDKKTGKLKDSCDAKVIGKQKHKSGFVPLYMEFKAIEKEVTTYGENFLSAISPVTGRVHTSFWQILDTGRTSSGGTDRKTKQVKPNLQNIPTKKKVRACFKGQRDNLLITNDFASQEPRITADKCQDPSLLKFYREGGGDSHSFVASKLFSVIEGKEVIITDKDDPRRQIGKVLNLKLDYGGSAYTVKDDLGTTQEEAQEFINMLEEAFPMKKEYFKKCRQEVHRDGYILINERSGRKSYVSFYEEYKGYEKRIRMPRFWEVYREHKLKESEYFKKELKPLVRKYFQLKGSMERNAQNYPKVMGPQRATVE